MSHLVNRFVPETPSCVTIYCFLDNQGLPARYLNMKDNQWQMEGNKKCVEESKANPKEYGSLNLEMRFKDI